MSNPDARPERIMVGSGQTVGPPRAIVKRSPPEEPGRWCVWRYREDGSMGMVTWHIFRRRADRAARIWEAEERQVGWEC